MDAPQILLLAHSAGLFNAQHRGAPGPAYPVNYTIRFVDSVPPKETAEDEPPGISAYEQWRRMKAIQRANGSNP